MTEKVPVVLLTGFLGAGKTTFLNWLLEKHPNLKVSVVLNEFGDVKLESQFVKQKNEGVIELANGCMCCVAKSDIPRVINYILDTAPQTQYILVEASGLSDPEPIRDALQDPKVSERVRLDAILCIVDALNFEALRQEHGLVTSQIADSDLVILSKVELSTQEKVDQNRKVLERLTPDVRVIEFRHDLDPQLFLDPEVRLHQAKSTTTSDAEHQHSHEQFQTYLFEGSDALDLEKLQGVIKTLPRGILRAKGVLRITTSDQKDLKVLLQYVGTRLEFEETQWGLLEPKKNTLLFIGTQLNAIDLEQLLIKCKHWWIKTISTTACRM